MSQWKNLTDSRVFRDCYAAAVVYIGTLLSGMDLTFTAYFLEGRDGLTVGAESLLGCTNMIFRSLGSLAASFIIDRLGRKRTVLMSLLFGLVAWTVIVASPTTPILIFGRALSGISTGLQFACVIYVSEVCHPDRRGGLVACQMVATTAGMLFYTCFAYFYHWRTVSVGAIILSIVGILLLHPLPESKYWYLFRGDRESAAGSVLWFSKNATSQEISVELFNIEQKILKTYTTIELLNMKQQMPKADSTENQWCCILRRKSELKPFLVCVLLVVCLATSPRIAVIAHLEHCFISFQTNFDSKKLVVWLTVFEFITCLVYTSVMDKFNRNTVLHCTTALMSCCIVGILFHNLELSRFHVYQPWIPISLFYLYMVLCVGGLMTSILLIMAETLNQKHRGALINLVSCIHLLAASTHSNILPYLLKYLDINVIFLYFWISVMLISVIVKFFVPESRGKALYDCAPPPVKKSCESSVTDAGDL